jgi:hypothetical protein
MCDVEENGPSLDVRSEDFNKMKINCMEEEWQAFEIDEGSHEVMDFKNSHSCLFPTKQSVNKQ